MVPDAWADESPTSWILAAGRWRDGLQVPIGGPLLTLTADEATT